MKLGEAIVRNKLVEKENKMLAREIDPQMSGDMDSHLKIGQCTTKMGLLFFA